MITSSQLTSCSRPPYSRWRRFFSRCSIIYIIWTKWKNNTTSIFLARIGECTRFFSDSRMGRTIFVFTKLVFGKIHVWVGQRHWCPKYVSKSDRAVCTEKAPITQFILAEIHPWFRLWNIYPPMKYEKAIRWASGIFADNKNGSGGAETRIAPVD